MSLFQTICFADAKFLLLQYHYFQSWNIFCKAKKILCPAASSYESVKPQFVL